MDIGDAVARRNEFSKKIEKMKKELNLFEEFCEREFGFHVWLDATNRSPVYIVNGNIKVNCGATIDKVIKYLHSLANAENRVVGTVFNEKWIQAEPDKGE